MKILIVGLGSMGKRRLRLLKNHFPNIVLAGVDAQESRRLAGTEFGFDVFSDLEEAISDFNPAAVFICTSPLAHDAITETCLSNGIHVFSEINLVSSGYDKNLALAREKDLKLFLSSTFLYRREIEFIRSKVKPTDLCVYTYHVGQYLPDWHPWENHKDFFLGDKRTNGCREILAINLPWLIMTFGEIESVSCVKQKVTELDIDYPDTYLLLLRHSSGSVGTFTADLVSRDPVCLMRIEKEDFLLTWDGKPDSLRRFDISGKRWNSVPLYDSVDKISGYSANIIEDAYLAEIQAFFSFLRNETLPRWTFESDQEMIRRVDEIERI